MSRWAAAWLAMACSGEPSAPVAGARVGLSVAAALTAADALRVPWRCAAADGPSVADETLTLGARRWRLGARAMTLDATGDVAIGVIADAAGSAPATLAALGRLRGKLGRVDLVVSLGGMGATRAELDAVLAVLADRASWPLVALPGDLEPAAAQAEAIAAARQRGALVIDGRLLQRIELPGATIELVPGAGAASRLAAGADGCMYTPSDAAAALADLAARSGLRILASAEAPRQPAPTSGPDGPTGDLAITADADHPIDVALHGPTSGTATAARVGNRDGLAVSVTPGSSDAMPRLPGASRLPSAGVLTLRGSAWSWQPIEDVK